MDRLWDGRGSGRNGIADPLSRHVGWAGSSCTTTAPLSCDIKSAVPVVNFTPPTGGEYVVSSTSATNFWRSQLGLRIDF